MNSGLFQHSCEDLNHRIYWISSKFFSRKTGLEIKDIDKSISTYFEKVHGVFVTNSEIKDVKDTIIMRGDALGRWPELPLVKKAKEMGGISYDMSLLPFPLEEKQLIIIWRMLFHPMDAVIFITTGVGGSGKSTFLNMVRQLFDNDCSNTSLTALSNDFVVAEATKHRLICSDEIGKGDSDEEMLKRLSAKNPMLVNPKNQTPYEIMSQSSIFYCCNKEPILDITDTGILRRIVYYVRNTPIKNPVEGMDVQRFTEEQLLMVARQAYSYEVGECGRKWKNLFLKETHDVLKKNLSVARLRKVENYDLYREECKRQTLKPYSQPRWEEIHRLLDEWDADEVELALTDPNLPF